MDYKNYIQQTLANAKLTTKSDNIELSTLTEELHINSIDKKILLNAISKGVIKTNTELKEAIYNLDQIKKHK
jgi:hypothetical protein